jgi:hypothetical protein
LALTAEQLARWSDLYERPVLVITAECRKALSWIEANRTRRKTARGMLRFLDGWIQRSTDRGYLGARGAPALHEPDTRPRPPVIDAAEMARRYATEIEEVES